MPGKFSIDLVTLATADATTNPSLVSNGWTSAPSIIDDYRIEGTNALMARASNTTAQSGWILPATASFTGSEDHIFVWMNNLCPASTDSKTNGGQGVFFSSVDNVWTVTGVSPNDGDNHSRNWHLDGKDTDNVGGFKCYVIDPRSSGSYDLGSPNPSRVLVIGVRDKTNNAIANNRFSLVWDTLRRGTGVRVTSGSFAGPVTFQDIFISGSNTTGSVTDINGIVSGAWGIVTNYGGTYYGAAKLKFGDGSQTTQTVFKDTGKSFVWRSYPVSSSFYEINVTASAAVTTSVQLGDYTGNISSLGCTISAPSGTMWNLNVIPPTRAHFMAYASQFGQMRDGTIQSGSTLQDCSFSGCGTLHVSGAAVLNGTSFYNNVSTMGSASLSVQNSESIANITECSFIGNNVAVELMQSGTYAFNGLLFANNTWDIWNRSGGAITASCTNGANPSQAKVLDSAGSSTKVENNVTLTLTGIVSGSEVRIYSTGTTTELAGAEDVLSSFDYTYTYSAGVYVDIVVHHVDYVYYRVDNYLLSSTAGSLPIQQSFDRNYRNP